MDKNPEISERLYQIHFQRNKNLWVFHFVLILISTYFQTEEIFSGRLWWISLLVMGVGLVCRNLLFYIFYEDWRSKRTGAVVFNYGSLLLVSAGWTLHFLSIVSIYGLRDYHTSHTLLLVSAVMMGGTVSSAANIKSFHTLFFPICLSIFIFYLSSETTPLRSILIYLVILYGFCVYYLNLGNKELKRTIENELVAEREKNKVTRIINAIPAFVSVYDKDLNCVAASKSTRFFYPEIIGKKLGGLEKNSDWESYVENFAKSGKTMSVDEASSTVGGKFRWTLRNCRRTSDGGVVFVSTDITELVATRTRLREQEAKAQYTAKLASLGEMAAGIAHEINNPLAIIQGSAAVIQRLLEVEPVDKENIDILSGKMIHTTNRISKIIRSLKALSRSGDNDPFQSVNLAEVLDQTLDICRTRCERLGIELKVPRFPDPVVFRAREVQISQVILNLLSNAIDAVKNLPAPWIEVSYKKTSQGLDIYVADSGPGVPEEIRNKIMEPFFTTKEVNQGTGLGLSISKTIMDSHNGELTLLEGSYTTFRIHLPGS